MKKTKLLLRIIPVFLFSSSILVLKAQIPAAIDTKMKSDNMRNFQLEEIKVRWKKAALENCPGVPCVPPVCPTSTVTDVDGNIYNTVAIGTQCWTKENLKVTKYNNNDIIPDSTNASNSNWGTVAIGARTDYVGVSGYVGTYGYLYNWHAATDPRKICPSGWHVPTDGEWRILIQSIDPTYITTNSSSTTAGGRMKTAGTIDWLTLNTGTNASGFSAKGGGFRRSFTGSGLSSDGNFDNININGFFWSTTTNNLNTGEAYFCFLLYVIDDVQMLFNTKGYGLSVRCVKD
jgi:uncharacterized protein (TIGR02145 family)